MTLLQRVSPAMPDRRAMRRAGDATHIAIHALLPVMLALVGFSLGLVVKGTTRENCTYELDYLPDWSLFWVGVASFVGGRHLSRLSHRRKTQPSSRGSSVVAQLALIFIFVGLVPLWFYEAVGTAHVQMTEGSDVVFEPITYYVRCAIYHDKAANGIGWWSMSSIALVSGLAGHWLWSYHPRLRPRRKRLRRVGARTVA
jgi:hypothetical protein